VPPVSIPVELEVVDWQLPDPRDFQTLVGCEQNPYGVAKQYGAELWSETHFRLLEASFRKLARIGNKWINVPVLTGTEYGNKDDAMIRWVRRGNGSLSFNYTILDRYLDLAVKHCGRPRVIVFVVMHGMQSPTQPPTPPTVKVLEEATGRSLRLSMGQVKQLPAPQQRYWRDFATSLYLHMKERGLEQAMYWGAPLEQKTDPQLKHLLAECTPAVSWTAGGHEIMANAKYAKN
jgi:hypothetical protein